MIPKKLHHIWVGPRKMPSQWMDTWKKHHPDWEYYLWGNTELNSLEFKNRELIDLFYHYGKYDGVADLMRYELLYEYGGFMPGADAECLRPIDELLNNQAITVYENEYRKGYQVSPILGASVNYSFLKFLTDYFYENCDTIKMGIPTRKAYELVGNYILGELVTEHTPDGLLILPSNALIGTYLNGGIGYYDSRVIYNKRYAVQHWGMGRDIYKDSI